MEEEEEEEEVKEEEGEESSWNKDNIARVEIDDTIIDGQAGMTNVAVVAFKYK